MSEGLILGGETAAGTRIYIQRPAICLSPDLFDRVKDMATTCEVSIPAVIERLMIFSQILTKTEMRRMEGLPAMGDYEMLDLMQDAEVRLENQLREKRRGHHG